MRRMERTGGTTTLSRQQRGELLGACPLFQGIGTSHLEQLVDRAIEVEFPADRVIARQGEIGTGFFVIVSGRVRVVRDGQILAQLGPGEFFGELSLLDRQPRVAQVVAEQPTTCLALPSWDFEQLLLEEPALTVSILRGIAGRLRAVTEQHLH
jgi:CRP-like cAMP-binding protein